MKQRIYYFIMALSLSLIFVMSSCDSVEELSDYNTVSQFTITEHSPATVEIGNPVIVQDSNAETDIIRIPVTAGELPLEFRASVVFEKKIAEVVGVDFSQKLVIDSFDEELPFVVVALSGMPRMYKIVAAPAVFSLPEKIHFSVISVIPADSRISDEAVYHDGVLYLTVTDPQFPLTIVPEFALDPDKYGFVNFTNGETSLTFGDAGAELEITVTDKINGSTETVPVKLDIKSGEGPSGAEVVSFSISSFSSTFKAVDVAIEQQTGTDQGEVIITLEEPGSCPVTMNYSMTLSTDAGADVAERGSHVFTSLNDVMEFTVRAADGTSKQWSVRFAVFRPALKGWKLDQWTWADWANAYIHPVPTGTKASPYWSNANMNKIATVKATTGISSPSGTPGDMAAQLKTEKTFGKMASGSLFLGWFDDSNIMVGLTDPKSMTRQGIPFSSTSRIKGVMVDVGYTSGTGSDEDRSRDTGSIAIELVKADPSASEYRYHGEGHAKNTASLVASGRLAVGNIAAGQVAGNKEKVDLEVRPGTWNRDVLVPLNIAGDYPAYTHLIVICSSSSKGDDLDGGAVLGSTLILDNIRIVYED